MVTIYPTGVTIHKPDKVCAGNTLYVFDGIARLINMAGEVLQEWVTNGGYHAKLLPSGNLLAFSDYIRLWDCAKLLELDNNCNIIWGFSASGYSLHHDFERLANGNTMMLCRKLTKILQISSAFIYDDFLQEVTPSKAIVWQWKTSDHFDEFGFTTDQKALIAQSTDWAHTNSFHILPDGNILVSQRNTNKLFIIDRVTNNIIWQVELTIGQHNPTLLSNNNILVLDNGGKAGYPEQSRLYSRVVEINQSTKQVINEYNATSSGYPNDKFFTSHEGSAQRLANGNTLINEAVHGRFFEVTTAGEIVWEFVNPMFITNEQGQLTNKVYRCYRS